MLLFIGATLLSPSRNSAVGGGDGTAALIAPPGSIRQSGVLLDFDNSSSVFDLIERFPVDRRRAG